MPRRYTNSKKGKDPDDKTKFDVMAEKRTSPGRHGHPSNRRRKSRDLRDDAARTAGVTERDMTKDESNIPGALNDIAWYSKNPELLIAAAQVPYPFKPGMMVPGGTFTDQAGTYTYNADTWLPGVCTVQFDYSVGYSNDTMSPASIAAREMFARIRSKFSGRLVADAPDIFMYCLALDQVHAYIAWLKRLYRLLRTYSP